MVWSDPEIIRLSKEFLPVADEVYMLYPEDRYNLDRVKNDPAHLFFKAFGERVPKEDWNHPGTKQGIYMIGPNGEYLGARFAASGPNEVRDELKKALNNWEIIKNNYSPKPIPAQQQIVPPEFRGKAVLLRVSLRDLPENDRDQRGMRFNPSQAGRQWMDFTKWAWNQNWIAFDSPTPLITDSPDWKPVPKEVANRIAQEVMVDNVRGQAGHWRDQDIRRLNFEVRRVRANSSEWVLEYRGSGQFSNGGASYAPRFFGEAIYSPRDRRFVKWDLVAVGERRGGWRFNQRSNDPGPSSLGIALRLHDSERTDE